jgi:hypothetical protein
MEDIGIKDHWEAAQWVFILSGVPKGYGRFHGERALGHPRPTNVNNIKPSRNLIDICPGQAGCGNRDYEKDSDPHGQLR